MAQAIEWEQHPNRVSIHNTMIGMSYVVEMISRSRPNISFLYIKGQVSLAVEQDFSLIRLSSRIHLQNT